MSDKKNPIFEKVDRSLVGTNKLKPDKNKIKGSLVSETNRKPRPTETPRPKPKK